MLIRDIPPHCSYLAPPRTTRIGQAECRARSVFKLDLVLAAIVLWNTVYLKRTIEALREDGHSIQDSLLPHLSPVGWEHINLTGDYIWHANKRVAKGRFRPLRRPQDSISRLFTANSEP
jgi:hypothetical protein